MAPPRWRLLTSIGQQGIQEPLKIALNLRLIFDTDTDTDTDADDRPGLR